VCRAGIPPPCSGPSRNPYLGVWDWGAVCVPERAWAKPATLPFTFFPPSVVVEQVPQGTPFPPPPRIEHPTRAQTPPFFPFLLSPWRLRLHGDQQGGEIPPPGASRIVMLVACAAGHPPPPCSQSKEVHLANDSTFPPYEQGDLKRLVSHTFVFPPFQLVPPQPKTGKHSQPFPPVGQLPGLDGTP